MENPWRNLAGMGRENEQKAKEMAKELNSTPYISQEELSSAKRIGVQPKSLVVIRSMPTPTPTPTPEPLSRSLRISPWELMK